MKFYKGILIFAGVLMVYLCISYLIDNLKKSNREKDEYHIAIEENTHSVYYDFMKKYPQSEYYQEVRQIDDEICWKMADSASNIKMYDWYLFVHPEGKYIKHARSNLDKLYIIEEATWKTESTAWNRAIQDNNYEKYLSYYPNGEHANEAEKRIVEGEIKRIMSGQYSSLPDMESHSRSSSIETSTSLISITNSTNFILTVYYSGIDSKRVRLAPNQSSTVTLEKGNYRIAALVDAPNVSKYAGTKYLSEDEYKSNYYIETRRY